MTEKKIKMLERFILGFVFAYVLLGMYGDYMTSKREKQMEEKKEQRHRESMEQDKKVLEQNNRIIELLEKIKN